MKTSARKIFKETKPITGSSTKIFAFNKTWHIKYIHKRKRGCEQLLNEGSLIAEVTFFCLLIF